MKNMIKNLQKYRNDELQDCIKELAKMKNLCYYAFSKKLSFYYFKSKFFKLVERMRFNCVRVSKTIIDT